MGKRFLVVAATDALLTLPALAGNIVLTGHDDDFHAFSTATLASMQLKAMTDFARAGSTTPGLPMLSFDRAGGELDSALTALGITHTNIDPATAAAVTDGLFDASVYSA